MTIKRTEVADAGIIYALERECFSDPWAHSIIEREIMDMHVSSFIVYENDVAVGYTFLRHIINEGHIENIAVHPDFRGRGFAGVLMEAVIKEAKAKEMIGLTLEVRQGNRAAMALYHKYRFYVSGYRRGYYTDPTEDAVIMYKDLV